MKSGGGSPSPVRYIAVILVSLALVLGSLSFADRTTLAMHLSLAAENRALQTELATRAIEEGFLRLLEENLILATYSFPDYLAGGRSDDSMNLLLAAELASYGESRVYAFYTSPEEPRFIARRTPREPGEAIIHEAVRDLWTDPLLTEGTPLVLSDSYDREAPFFILLYPVYHEGAPRGILGTVVSFRQAREKFLLPLSARGQRIVAIENSDSTLLWSSSPDRSLATLDEETYLIETRSFDLANERFSIITAEAQHLLLQELQSMDSPRKATLLVSLFVLFLISYMTLRVYNERKYSFTLQEEERRLEGAVRTREAELRESELRYRSLVEHAQDGIIILDKEARILDGNPRAAQLFGLPREDLIGSTPGDLSPEFQVDGTPSTRSARELIDSAIAGRSLSVEWVHRRADGTSFDAEVSLASFPSAEGPLAQVIIRDITTRKQNERILAATLEERELLLRELFHRVKNNFQFLDSLIELHKTLSPGNDTASLEKVQSRISALASAYILAVDTTEHLRVDSRAYLYAIAYQVLGSTEALEGGDGHHPDRSPPASVIEGVPLPLDVAAPLGLIVRELLENIALHGHTSPGEIPFRITLTRTSGGLELSLRDYGPGESQNIQEGLGITIVRALTQQLKGSYRIISAHPGIEVTITIPGTFPPTREPPRKEE